MSAEDGSTGYFLSPCSSVQGPVYISSRFFFISPLLKLALLLNYIDHVASVIVNANHSIM